MGSAPLGPLLDVERARARSEWSGGRPGVWGGDVGVCQQFGRREYFSFCPPGWDRAAFFSVPVSAGAPDGLAGQEGGPI